MKPVVTRYASSGDVKIAYQTVGQGAFDLVLVPGLISNLDLAWEDEGFALLLRRLPAFARLILFDKRGTGLSDRVDAAGLGRAAIPGMSEGAPTLLIHRRQDVGVNPETGRFLARAIPGAQLAEIPGRDHPIWTGDVDRIVGLVEEFLTCARAGCDLDRVPAALLASAIRDSGRPGDRLLARFDSPARAIRRATARESEVKTLIADGLSEHAVKRHVANILAKLDLPSRAAAAAFAARKDIEATLGQVPDMPKAVPEIAIAGAWAEIKAMQPSPDAALDPRTRELMGLSVASQIPCSHCVYFHTGAAELHGATEREIKEAATMRRWSTMLNGSQVDPATFQRQTDEMLERAAKAKAQ